MVAVASGTVAEALTAASDALAAAGCGSPRLDAELLLEEATGLGRHAFATEPQAPVEARAARRFGEMVRRRVRREPVAYILGRKGFRNLELLVDPRVLIPRPETELLVEVALALRPRSVLDVGTGSGAVALAIADEAGDVSVMGVDVSEGAIAVARLNAQRFGLDVDFEVMARPLAIDEERRQPERRWDVVVANLPYVREDEWEGLAPEITRYEPPEALLGGPDGLEHIRALLIALPDCAAVAVEVGEGQAPEVAELVRGAGFSRMDLRRDLAGIDRVVVGLG